MCISFSLTGFVPLITKFGMYGDGEEYKRVSTYRTGFNVLCGSNNPNTTFEWMFGNGSHIGVSNPGFRAAHFNNGKWFNHGELIKQLNSILLWPYHLLSNQILTTFYMYMCIELI